MADRPHLTITETLDGTDLVRVGKEGRPILARVAAFRGPNPTPTLDGLKKDLAAEVTARAAGDKGNTDAILAEAQARTDADKALAVRLPIKLTGTLSLPAGLAILAGKTTRTVAVLGLKAGDDMTVTAKAAVPAGVAMAETLCLADGVLTVALTAVALVTIAAKTDIPLGVVALR